MRRASGVLLHIACLPSAFGIGDLGDGARRWQQLLSETAQSFWQVLPLSPTEFGRGNSPYSSPSAFAGNPLLIGPERLMEEDLLTKSDLMDVPSFPNRTDYPAAWKYKEELLKKAYQRFKRRKDRHFDFDQFCRTHAHWLEHYVLFVALKEAFGGRDWSRWPPAIRDRKPREVKRLAEKFRERMERERFFQYLFFNQWSALKEECNARGIQMIGDFPIYVDFDSPDVWANPDLFKLDSDKKPSFVAGVPPDYFSSTGQLWGNPIYRWDVLKERGYSWWVRRVAHNLKLFDLVRLDHFKGFSAYWEVPAGETTAVKGAWMKGPGSDFFNALLKHFPYLPFIAEDLGVIDAEVRELRDRFGFLGMRVLQFAFGNDPLADEYKPINYVKNCVAYTGTHDNDTLLGWLFGNKDYSTRKPEEIATEKKNTFKYLACSGKRRKDIHWEFIRLLMMSAADLVIVPTQDLLGLGSEGRMNRPGTAAGNWEWRLSPDQLDSFPRKKLLELTSLYGRT